jgi:hypothetical protein
LAVGGWRLAVGGWRLAVGGWRLAVGGWRLAVGGWRLAVGGWRFQQSLQSHHHSARARDRAMRPAYSPKTPVQATSRWQSDRCHWECQLKLLTTQIVQRCRCIRARGRSRQLRRWHTTRQNSSWRNNCRHPSNLGLKRGRAIESKNVDDDALKV